MISLLFSISADVISAIFILFLHFDEIASNEAFHSWLEGGEEEKQCTSFRKLLEHTSL